jgi:sugar/nucleoside kinase (ribokinase family)
LLKVGKKLPSEEDMRSILLVAAEAATACCEKHGAMEAMPTFKEVKARFNSRNETMPLSL